MENSMNTLAERALHYVECYNLQFPNSGADDVAEELREAVHLGGIMNGEPLDSGYQMICMSGTLSHPHHVGDWLAEQLQWEANSKERITRIDAFQVIETPGGWYGIAICRITKQA